LNEENNDVKAPVPEAAPAQAPAARPGRSGFQGKGRPKFRQRPEAKKDDGSVERVIVINRVSKVVKGGKNFSFNAVVVAGDGKGNVGVGIGKSKEVSEAITKGASKAKKNFYKVHLMGDTIPHEVIGTFKATRVLLKPAAPGTGVIAGGPVRALCDAVGVKNILTKCFGSRNPLNVLRAARKGFDQLRSTRRG